MFSNRKKLAMAVGCATAVAGIAFCATNSLEAQTQYTNVPGLLTFTPSAEQPSNLLAVQQHTGGDAIVWMPYGHTLQLKTRTAGQNGDRVSVTSEGAVGIGTTAPQGKLDVRGDLYVTGTIYINGRALR